MFQLNGPARTGRDRFTRPLVVVVVINNNRVPRAFRFAWNPLSWWRRCEPVAFQNEPAQSIHVPAAFDANRWSRDPVCVSPLLWRLFWNGRLRPRNQRAAYAAYRSPSAQHRPKTSMGAALIYYLGNRSCGIWCGGASLMNVDGVIQSSIKGVTANWP